MNNPPRGPTALPEPADIEAIPEDYNRLHAASQGIVQAQKLVDRYKTIRKDAIVAMREQGLTLARVADVAGVDPSMVSRIAAGQRR